MKGYPTVFNNIIFIESDIEEFKKISDVKVDLSFKIGAQLKNLDDVKEVLASQAHTLDANCIINFKYGQKSRWLAIDDVAFFGSGSAGLLSESKYNEVIEFINNRNK